MSPADPKADCGGIVDGRTATRDGLLARGMSEADADKVLAIAARMAKPEVKPGEPFTVVCHCGARSDVTIDPEPDGWVVGVHHSCRAYALAAAPAPAARPAPEEPNKEGV